MKRFLLLTGFLMAAAGNAVAEDARPFPSVEERLSAMDRNHDGMVMADEVRAYIELAHGKEYSKEVLDSLESSVNSRSCASPFSNLLF